MESTVRINLPATKTGGKGRECRMSLDFYQNARMTMGELRDLVREGAFSWEFLEHQIAQARKPKTALDRAMEKMDDYTTGLGKTLRGKPSNVR